ncbi:1,4-alpha-glucan branching protein GlgB [Lachnospiraceae bacterium DSM 108991]|uniref:1,4-alpha-glucan branching enzyme n=1 Tax=Claveliimonas monacensis TaxID=2779351 RepID=A0ABR9RIL7_9FIRM|nr:1,4-alpha-glucan branching protein GlgB [Claveliimonas monacensis]MBE5062813.1 1,4-alpha-glucan branching protein GlgB [Claveliimonas monacensis]
MDFYGFYTGKIFDAHEYLGAHVQDDGTTFRTFAPSASRVSLIGEFSGWQELPMEKVHDGNFWEVHVKDTLPGMMYKYRIYGGDGRCIDHCDPYGYGMELRPATASIIRSRDSFHFQDQAWMKKRSDCRDKPLNIYEIHFGSFRKPSDEPDAWYTYDELADLLIPHLKEAGYNYLEIMPLAEYPCDDSWGYQGTGFFSPTSRYGTMDQFKSFINACHRSGIGVILDFVPIHFAVDDYALAHYDGTALYEYPHSAVGYSEWGSCNFMHSRGEVRSFLQSAADYWLSEFHIDGLRMDAISRAIYWQGDPARGVNGNAVDFLRNMNQGLKKRYPDVILAAEDSTSFPDITRPAEEGGLGFDYKWDMGWMNDTLNYFRTAPSYRTAEYHKLTFSMAYYYQERYLLPLSHDEVVHGKATIMQKMYGDYDGKFPQARAFYMYMYAHPGKKLNFMGNEIGQLREWDEKREQDWCLLSYPAHDGFFHFMADLNHFYLEHSSLWEQDYEEGGFQWLDCHQEEKCIYAFERRSRKERLVAVFNFSDKKVDDFVLKVPGAEALIPVFSSDLEMYGGASREKRAKIKGEYQLFQIDMSPYSALYFTVK